MNLAALLAALNKITPLVGDAGVVFHDIESGVESVIHSVSIDLTADGDASGSTVTVKHGPAAPAPAPEPTPEPPAEPVA